jgi:hypothetical protein
MRVVDTINDAVLRRLNLRITRASTWSQLQQRREALAASTIAAERILTLGSLGQYAVLFARQWAGEGWAVTLVGLTCGPLKRQAAEPVGDGTSDPSPTSTSWLAVRYRPANIAGWWFQ